MTSDSSPPTEVEISLEENAELDLTAINIDSENLPLRFSVDGIIHNIDKDILEEVEGKEMEPIAVRFRLLSTDE